MVGEWVNSRELSEGREWVDAREREGVGGSAAATDFMVVVGGGGFWILGCHDFGGKS
jgi:hypothetical protein